MIPVGEKEKIEVYSKDGYLLCVIYRQMYVGGKWDDDFVRYDGSWHKVDRSRGALRIWINKIKPKTSTQKKEMARRRSAAASRRRKARINPMKKRKTKQNPGMGLLLLLGGGALALYLLTKKKDTTFSTPGSQTFVGPMPKDTSTTAGSQNFVGPMPQDHDLPPVPDPMSSYNYTRG